MAEVLSKKDEEDRNYIMLSDDWEVQYWSEELGSTRNELSRLIDKYGSSAAKIRRILRGMAEEKRKTEDDIARENARQGEAGQGKMTPQRKEQMPKSGEFDGHVA